MNHMMNESITLLDYIAEHCEKSIDRALLLARRPLWKRSCPDLSDKDFIRLGLLRGISPVDSGRHFLQLNEEVYGEICPHSTYFKALKSSRRMEMLKATEKQSYEIHCESMILEGVDYLKQFEELNDYTVYAADGHYVDHAYHTPKDSNGKVYAAGFIYAMNLRNGLLKPLSCVTNGTIKHQEIPVLRQYVDQENRGKNKSVKDLYVYDKAATDYAWWNKQKYHQNYMISLLKENSTAVWCERIPFDKNAEINIGIESYSTYESKGVKFSVVKYFDPETGKEFDFVSTLPESIEPGIIAVLYYKRWTIEKAFNNNKSNLKEKKAWSSNMNSLNNEMRFTTMSYNIMRVFEETSKTQNPEKIHPSEKKYTDTLKKRDLDAKQGFFVNPLLYQERIARISSYTIRAIQNAIVTGKSLVSLMSQLLEKLVPRLNV